LHHRLSDKDVAAIVALPHRIRKLEAQSYTLREGDRHCGPSAGAAQKGNIVQPIVVIVAGQ